MDHFDTAMCVADTRDQEGNGCIILAIFTACMTKYPCKIVKLVQKKLKDIKHPSKYHTVWDIQETTPK